MLYITLLGKFSINLYLLLYQQYLSVQVEYFKNAIETMATGSLRCVAIAYRPMKEGSFPTNEEELEYWQMPEDELVLLAIIGLKVLNLYLCYVRLCYLFAHMGWDV